MSERGPQAGRRLASVLVRTGWSVHVHGAKQAPAAGGVIASNHTNFLDGPLLLGAAPRPVHCLSKRELFRGPVGWVLRGVGQIPINREGPDREAVSAALQLLRDGQVLAEILLRGLAAQESSRRSAPALLTSRSGPALRSSRSFLSGRGLAGTYPGSTAAALAARRGLRCPLQGRGHRPARVRTARGSERAGTHRAGGAPRGRPECGARLTSQMEAE